MLAQNWDALSSEQCARAYMSSIMRLWNYVIFEPTIQARKYETTNNEKHIFFLKTYMTCLPPLEIILEVLLHAYKLYQQYYWPLTQTNVHSIDILLNTNIRKYNTPNKVHHGSNMYSIYNSISLQLLNTYHLAFIASLQSISYPRHAPNRRTF